jgi:hypothetical protein
MLTFVALSVGVALVGLGSYYFLVPGPLAPFAAELHEVATGTLRYGNRTGPYVNFSLSFSSPLSLDPWLLVIKVSNPNGLAGNWPGEPTTAVDVEYHETMIPHWIAMPAANSYSTSYTAAVTNPDGRVVGGRTLGEVGSNNIARTVLSGSIVMLTFPFGVRLTGYTITLSYRGHPGTAAVILS